MGAPPRAGGGLLVSRHALLVLLSLAVAYAAGPPAPHFSTSRSGMVSTGSSYATAAGVRMLDQGGNAIDAAAAAALAIMVTDPANTSIGGRTQILLRLKNGQVLGIDGATQVPAGMPRKDPSEKREGFQVAPVPGAPAALDFMVKKYGRKPWRDVMAPAIDLAGNGFVVPPRLARTWATMEPVLKQDPGTARNFLKPDGSAYQAGEIFRQPRLATLLQRIASEGSGVLYHGAVAKMIAQDVTSHGGWLSESDLAGYRVADGKLARTQYRGFDIVTGGARSWGSSLHEMLNILGHFTIGPGSPTAEEIEITARAISQSLADRPREGSREPEPGFGTPKFYSERAELIRARLSSRVTDNQPHDTTHLSFVDAEGNAVALTTSVGPSFGSHVATPELGFIYAHSYRMAADAIPGERDMTEMSPSIVLDRGTPVLVVGGAGSERIPSAVLQVISNVIDRHMDLEQAIRAPRVFLTADRLRMHEGFSPEVVNRLRARGFTIENVELGVSLHLGLVHAIQFDPSSGIFTGGADLGDSGSAQGPETTVRKK